VKIGIEFNEDPEWKNWVWCQGEKGQRAWVPTQFIDLRKETGFLNRYYNALELSLIVGDELISLDEMNGFIMAKKKNGKTGWAPLNYLKEI